MYVEPNFKTKKALREAVARGDSVSVFSPGLGGPPPREGRVYLEGPHFPQPHTWYASADLEGGEIVALDGKKVALSRP